MKHRLIRLSSIAAAVGFAAMTAAGSAAAQTGVINACVDNMKKTLRIADTCSAKETPLSWNQQGQKGDKGETGSPGTPGAAGLDGVSGYEVSESVLLIPPPPSPGLEYVFPLPCPTTGKKVLGGGVMDPVLDPYLWKVKSARPDTTGDAFLVVVSNNTGAEQHLTVSFVCADMLP
jgi:hypothetical protein